MIDIKQMTIHELRNLFNNEESEESEKLLMGLVKVAKKTNNKSAFFGLLMVLIGNQNPSRKFCEFGFIEGLTSSGVGSLKSNFTQNGNKLWNYKGEDGYYNILFGDIIIGAKDDRKMSSRMKAFIENGIPLDNTVEEVIRVLIEKIENSIHSTREERQSLIQKINTCYEELDLSSVSFEAEESGQSTVNKTNVLQVKLEKLINNGVQQIVLTGAPGTGKTYFAKKFAKNLPDVGEINGEKFAFVQFHSSYDYTDFVEGLRPVQIEDGQTQFVKLDGSFKDFCRAVVKENEPNKKYFFIIDEINRADLSRVFGELMYGLEEQYRETIFQTQYSNLPTYEMKNKRAVPMVSDVFENGFFIPKNVYIIATMNDIDRSVEAFDFALRRRFQWIEVKANDVMKDALEGMQQNNEIHQDINLHELIESVKALNSLISGEEGRKMGLTEAHHIGPAYLKSKASDIIDAKGEIWEYRIEPILKEYCRGYHNTQQFLAACESAFLGLSKDE
ncbi:McrB family protein [Ureibacillus endophyticus]|uniref:AAA family ATPase n=1 Tax=Ureibacillus endophyticus TaxID=1978490 RepID=A0A494Z4L5_9BACL|nr:AAA family ATPase [Lysinibacillus endophyticus]RKQ16925.1 AAA family ATPase [Lysinibacillus endophyticus]